MKLTFKEQRAILDGNAPSLVGLARFEIGQTIELTSRVSVRIDKRNLKHGRVTWDYTVIDNRDRVLRFRPPVRGKQVPAEELSASAIEKAAEQSSYDGNPRDPMDAGLVVPSEYQTVISMQAHAREADRRQQENHEANAKEQSRHLAKQVHDVALGLARSGFDPVPFLADVQRRVATERDRMRNAA